MQITTINAEGIAFRDPHPEGKSTIFGLQALRFIAAAMVVVTHVLNREVNLYHPYPLPRAPWMEAGVDIFFVISGFIMVYIIKPETRAGAFWLQRFTRIAPLYWAATVVAFLGGLVLPEWFFGRQGWSYALQSMLFVPVGTNSDAHPLISPGWTLIYEFAFYTILAFCLALRRPPFATAVVAILLLVAGGAWLGHLVPWLAFYSDKGLMLEFLFGMGAAVLVREHALRPWHGLIIAAAGLGLIYALWDFQIDWPRGMRAGLPAMLTVVGFLISEPIWRRNRLLRGFARLGDASYSIYIIHFFFVTAIATLFTKSTWLAAAVGPYGYVAVSVAAGLGSGIFVHLLVEKPLLRLVRSWLPGRERPGLVAAAAKV
jgi:exopolysaccharide production protein ExoZ